MITADTAATEPCTKPFDTTWLLGTGLLYEFNRQVLHPMGYALSVNVDTGLFQLWGDGSEPWEYSDEIDAQFVGMLQKTFREIEDSRKGTTNAD